MDRDSFLREGLLGEVPPRAPGSGRSADGGARVRIGFVRGHGEPEREVRVPSGVCVFDAASWNGIAIDSTCGGHGTCK